MYIGNSFYSQFTLKRSFSLHITHPHMYNPNRRLEVHIIMYYTTDFLIWKKANRTGSVSSVSILLEETVSYLGSPNFIFIVLAFRKIIIFAINVYSDLKRCTLNIPHMY